MTNEQVQTCDDLWRELIERAMDHYQAGMWVSNADDDVWVCLSGGQYPTWIDITSGEQMFPEFGGDHGEIFATMSVDWAHPATIGCLLALAREAFDDPLLHVALLTISRCWIIRDRNGVIDIRAETEPEVLLRAILATRGKR